MTSLGAELKVCLKALDGGRGHLALATCGYGTKKAVRHSPRCIHNLVRLEKSHLLPIESTPSAEPLQVPRTHRHTHAGPSTARSVFARGIHMCLNQ